MRDVSEPLVLDTRNYLDITWADEDGDAKLRGILARGMAYLDHAAGAKPAEKLVRKGVLRYQRRTVGIRRHYAALSAGARVDLLLRVPYRQSVSAQDVAVPTLDGRQYRITLVQVPEDTGGSRHWANGPTTARGGASAAQVMDLTLERLERDYDMSG